MSLESKARLIAERTAARAVAAAEDPTRIDLDLDPTTQRLRGVAVHGNQAFDMALITHVEGNLWQGGTMTGLVLPEGIQHLVSLYPWERYTVRHQLKTEVYIEAYDAFGPVTPEMAEQFQAAADVVEECLADGPTIVLCQAGLNRSGTVAALVLMHGGRTADEAIALLREKRSPSVLCNPGFVNWLRSLEVTP